VRTCLVRSLIIDLDVLDIEGAVASEANDVGGVNRAGADNQRPGSQHCAGRDQGGGSFAASESRAIDYPG